MKRSLTVALFISGMLIASIALRLVLTSGTYIALVPIGLSVAALVLRFADRR
jgi:hypothetical protein